MANLGKIKDVARQKNITLGVLANRIDISEAGLYKMIRNNSTSIETLEKIAKVLECSILEFFDEGNIVNVNNNSGSTINAAGGNLQVSEPSIKQALDEIAEQRKLTAEAQRQSADLINIVKQLTTK